MAADRTMDVSFKPGINAGFVEPVAACIEFASFLRRLECVLANSTCVIGIGYKISHCCIFVNLGLGWTYRNGLEKLIHISTNSRKIVSACKRQIQKGCEKLRCESALFFFLLNRNIQCVFKGGCNRGSCQKPTQSAPDRRR